jgi:hypothetical protein
MRTSDSLGALAAALVAAQAEIKAVAKDSTNPHFRSKFASLDGIIESVRPTLAKHGLAVLQGASSPVTDEAGALCGFAIDTRLIHKSGEWIENTAIMPLAKVDPQGAGSAMTYGRRYGLSALLSLSTDEDDDANAATHRTQTQQERGNGSRSTASSAPSTSNASSHAAKKLPFGDKKGTPLGELDTDELEKLAKWCKVPDRAEKFKDLATSVAAVLADRSLAGTLAKGDGDDELPF